MSICDGCGGIIGRDCFNPSECKWIAEQQAQDMQQRQYERQMEEDYYRDLERQRDEEQQQREYGAYLAARCAF